MAHTYAIVEVSKEVYKEIRGKLEEAGYGHAVEDGIMDMHGLALKVAEEPVIVRDCEVCNGSGKIGKDHAH
jgi:hypothetical protein